MQDQGGPEGSLEYRADARYAQPDTILADDPSLSGHGGYPQQGPMSTGYGPGNYPPPPTDHAGPGSYSYAPQAQPEGYPPQVQTPPVYPPAGGVHRPQFDPAMGGESGRIIVDMHAPTMNADQVEASPNYPGGFAPPPQPIPVADPRNGAAPPADDPATAQLYEWLGRRGIGPAYFSSYVRARNIIWGGDPGGPVDPEDLERALAARASRATPKQLDNLRDLGSLLTQYYGVREPAQPSAQPAQATVVPSAPISQRASAAAPAAPQPDSGSGPVLTADDLLDDAADVPAPGRRHNPHPTTEIPVEVDAEPHPTPVPLLLQESAADMQLDRAVLDVDVESTGATPLVALERDANKPEAFPDSPTWSLPQGFASAWDPRTRDQRPNEVLRPPRSPLVTFGVPVALLLLIGVVLYFTLGG